MTDLNFYLPFAICCWLFSGCLYIPICVNRYLRFLLYIYTSSCFITHHHFVFKTIAARSQEYWKQVSDRPSLYFDWELVKRYFDKQFRPRWDDTWCGISSLSTLFVKYSSGKREIINFGKSKLDNGHLKPYSIKISVRFFHWFKK